MTNIYKTILFVITILSVYLFDLIPHLNQVLDNYNSNGSKKIILLLILIALFLNLFIHSSSNKMSYGFTVTVLSLLFVCVLVVFGTSVTYHETLPAVLSTSYTHLVILGYFAFHDFFKKKENMFWFIRLTICTCFAFILLQVIQWFFFKFTGTLFLSYTSFGSYFIDKTGKFYEAGEFVTFAQAVFVFSHVLTRSSFSIKDYLFILLNLFYCFFVNQGRVGLIIFLSFLLIYYVFFLNMKYKSLFKIIILPISLIVTSWLAVKLFEYFNFTSGTNVASYTVRTLEIQYYLASSSLNGWFGIGFPSEINYYYLLHGSSNLLYGGLYSISDVGIVGFIGQFGYIGIMFILILIAQLLISINSSRNKAASFLLIFFVLAQFGSLFPTDSPRILFFSITLIMIDFSKKYEVNQNVRNSQEIVNV